VKKYNLEDELSDEEESNISKPVNKHEIQPAEEKKAEDEREINEEEQIKKSQDRLMKLKALSLKMRSPGGINDLEKEPAYKRRNIKLEDTPHSSESNVSRYTLGEDEEKKTTLRPNNSFLHDNVD
jgi:cell division protein FtsZ